MVGYLARTTVDPSKIISVGSGHLLVMMGDSVVAVVRCPMVIPLVVLSKITYERRSVVGGYEIEIEVWVCLISALYLFLLLISQICDALVENLNLFLIILDILIEFLNLFLDFMLLTRFKFKYERSSSLG